jgi:hypothetical protein
MSTPLVTSVKVVQSGAHEHVRIWVRGQFVGTLIVGKGDGVRMQQAFGDPTWLVKDFHVLYRTALDVSESVVEPSRETPPHRNLRAQLERLAPAFAYCEGERETARLLATERNEAGT